jgi:hypothetical protein
MTEAEARLELEAMLAYTSDPPLTGADIDDLLRRARRADRYGRAPQMYPAWHASQAYVANALIVPVPANGHVYRVTVAGTTAATPPVWPTTSGATVTDGGVTFAEAGAPAWEGTWDLDSAAAAGWRLKAAKAAGRVDVGLGTQRLARSQTPAFCLAMARVYAARIAQTVPVPGSLEREAWVETN